MNKKEAVEFMWCIVFAIFITIIIGYSCNKTIDSQVEKECKSCGSEYEWCEGYWKEKGRCGR